MIFSELFRLVWVNIIENKFKVVLTSLGIIVGAATIVLVIAIGRGGQMDVEDQFKNLNASAIDVSYKMDGMSSRGGSSGMSGGMMGGGMSPGGASSRSGRNSGGGSGSMSFSVGGMPSGMIGGFAMQNTEKIILSEEEVEDIQLFVPDVTVATISCSAKKEVSGGDLEEAASYTIAGVKPEYTEVSNLSMAVGDFITDEDDENLNKAAVIGANLAEEIFGSAINAYDSVLYIDGRSFTINGVLQTMGTVSSGISPDDAIFIPYSTALKYVTGNDVSPQITVIASDVKKVDEVMQNIGDVLAETYPNANFTITDAGSKMEAASKSANTLSALLIAVASIVFIVGGIGIMNVLFVTVKERTQEIGILKALGCSKKDILLEFLLESNMISTFGGLVGIGISFAVVPAVRSLGMRVEPTAAGAVMALVFAVATGTIFGFYPAKKAASLVPVEALNQD